MKARVVAVWFVFTTGCAVGTGGVGVQAPAPVAEVQVEAEQSREQQLDVAAVPVPAPDPAPAPEVVDDDLYGDEPDLVPMENNANLRVVYGLETPVFFTDGFYWRFGDDGIWMRSSIHTGGWAVHGDIPVHVSSISDPTQYRYYKPTHYTPRPRKVGVRPANSRPSHHPIGSSTAHQNYNNRPKQVTTHTQPAQPKRDYGNNRSTHTAPAHTKAAPKQTKTTTTKTTTTKATPKKTTKTTAKRTTTTKTPSKPAARAPTKAATKATPKAAPKINKGSFLKRLIKK
jgi:hypothetical protein